MMNALSALKNSWSKLTPAQRQKAASLLFDPRSYRNNPVAYARDVLNVTLWAKQEHIARLLLTPPYRVLVKASHNVGKSFLAATIVNWWYDQFDPGLALTTASTDTQVRDVLWKEVRVQRKQAGLRGFRGPKMPRLESSPNHWAHGFTARDGDAFQGRHDPHILIVFDEAVGVDPVFWETAQTMFGGEGHAWLCIFNPTDTTSRAYIEEMTGNWHVVTMSALEHPNILNELVGLPPPYPGAIRLGRLNEMLKEWCSPVSGQPRATDINWPPGSDMWLRPGPIAESRLLGRWPSQGTYGVWSDADWQAAESLDIEPRPDWPLEIGCDVARFGDDFTEIHVRQGKVSLHHESANGWSTSETAGRLKQLANEWGARCKRSPKKIPIKIDDDGVGGGVTDQRDDYNFIPVSGASRARQESDYPNRRSELWFNTALLARSGEMSLAKIPLETRVQLRRQAMAPQWNLDSAGRRVVEKKEETKEKLARSPDGMDAVNLAYYGCDWAAPEPLDIPDRPVITRRESAAGKRGLFGRSR